MVSGEDRSLRHAGTGDGLPVHLRSPHGASNHVVHRELTRRPPPRFSLKTRAFARVFSAGKEMCAATCHAMRVRTIVTAEPDEPRQPCSASRSTRHETDDHAQGNSASHHRCDGDLYGATALHPPSRFPGTGRRAGRLVPDRHRFLHDPRRFQLAGRESAQGARTTGRLGATHCWFW